MDEQNQKTLTIEDILSQLAKPSVLKGLETPTTGSFNTPTTKGPSTFSQPQSSTTKQTPDIILPQLKKSQAEVNIKTAQTEPQQQESRTFIRTMSIDLERLRKGQSPLGLEVKTKPLTPPQRPIPKTPVPTPILPPSISRSTAPIAPITLTRPPIINVPQVKPSPRLTPPTLPTPTIPRRPIAPSIPTTPRPPLAMPPSVRPPIQPSASTPAQTQTSGEEIHHHTERIISEKDLLPAFLGAPIPKRVAKTKKEKIQYGLIAKIIGSGMTVGITITVVIAIIAYLLVYILLLKPKEVITSTPAPTVTETPKQEVDELEAIFQAISSIDFIIPEDKTNATSSLQSFLTTQILAKKEFKKINFINQTDSSTAKPNFINLLDTFLIHYPQELKNVVSSQSITLSYGQEELFSDATDNAIPKKLIFIVEVNNVDKTKEIIKTWELTMPSDLKGIFSIDPAKEGSLTFLNNERRGVQIRYKNFPLPDKTIDYSVISSITGRHYLLLTNSRESMYSPADRLQGL